MANILLENDALRKQVAELQDEAARARELAESNGVLRTQIAAHEATIETLRSELTLAVTGREQDRAEHDALFQRATQERDARLDEMAKQLAALPSVAAGVAAELNKLGVPPVPDGASGADAGQTWTEKYLQESNPQRRAKLWAEHRNEILDGK